MAAITSQWSELVRLKASIETGGTLPSVILRKLAAAGPGNALSRALRAVGRVERTLFTLQWLSDPDLRQRSHAGLNKGEASNSLRRAVFFHRQGEIRDRTFENQSFRASGLSLITAAIVHWNTVYLERAVQHLRAQGVSIPGRSAAACSAAWLGAHRFDRRLRLGRHRTSLKFPPAERCSSYVHAPSGLACSFGQIVRRPLVDGLPKIRGSGPPPLFRQHARSDMSARS